MKPELHSADISPLKTDLLQYVGDRIEDSGGVVRTVQKGSGFDSMVSLDCCRKPYLTK